MPPGDFQTPVLKKVIHFRLASVHLNKRILLIRKDISKFR